MEKEIMRGKLRKTRVFLLAIVCIFGLSGCSKSGKYDVKIVIPAGSTAEIVYSEEEISPMKSTVTIYAGEGLGDTEVVLKPVGAKGTFSGRPVYLTPGMPVKIECESGEWYRVGVSVQNPGSEDLMVYVSVQGAELRIRCE